MLCKCKWSWPWTSQDWLTLVYVVEIISTSGWTDLLVMYHMMTCKRNSVSYRCPEQISQEQLQPSLEAMALGPWQHGTFQPSPRAATDLPGFLGCLRRAPWPIPERLARCLAACRGSGAALERHLEHRLRSAQVERHQAVPGRGSHDYHQQIQHLKNWRNHQECTWHIYHLGDDSCRSFGWLNNSTREIRGLDAHRVGTPVCSAAKLLGAHIAPARQMGSGGWRLDLEGCQDEAVESLQWFAEHCFLNIGTVTYSLSRLFPWLTNNVFPQQQNFAMGSLAQAD